jgi:ribosome-associated protein
MNRSNSSSFIKKSAVSIGSPAIPDDELVFVAARASGPGGQNVNKVETKIRLAFDFRSSRALSERQKAILSRSKTIQAACNLDGVILITAQEHRSQGMNKAEAKKRLIQLITTALKPIPKRIKTKPTLASKRRRLESKTHRSATKRLRRADVD